MIRTNQGTRSARTAPPEIQVGQQVRAILGRFHPEGHRIERRSDGRSSFPFLVELTPVDGKTLEPLGKTIVVVGKDLSEHGFGFYHQSPLPYRHAVLSIESPDGDVTKLLIDLGWCRFTVHGWYENGGRLLRTLATESEAA